MSSFPLSLTCPHQADEWLGLGRVDRVGRVSAGSAKAPLMNASSAKVPLIHSQVRCLPPRHLPFKLQDALSLLQWGLSGSGNVLATAGLSHRSGHMPATTGLNKLQCTSPGLRAGQLPSAGQE